MPSYHFLWSCLLIGSRQLRIMISLVSFLGSYIFFAFRHEDQFLISGLSRPPTGLTTKEWQEGVKADVCAVVLIILGRECKIDVVHNQTGTKKVTTYLVKMTCLQDARDVRFVILCLMLMQVSNLSDLYRLLCLAFNVVHSDKYYP